ncbi:hypothetical protein ACHAXS_009021 [Conticribra weissflogii]
MEPLQILRFYGPTQVPRAFTKIDVKMIMKHNINSIALFVVCPSLAAGGWIAPSHYFRNDNSAGTRNLTHKFHTFEKTTKSTTQLTFIKYIDPDPNAPLPIELTPEQDQVLRSAASVMEEKYGISWFEQSQPWDDLKAQHPSLQEYSEDELRRAYVSQSPTIVELFVKTPLGPFLLLNLIFFLSGFSWCDTPFHAEGACSP